MRDIGGVLYQEINSLFDTLGTSEAGLSSEEAERRLEKYGKNELKEKEKIPVLQLFLSQFKSILIFILVLAAIISALLGELLDTAVIIFTVFLAGVLSFVQEYRAEKAIELLKSLTSPEAFVIRDGVERKVPSQKLVPGDLILLQTGDRITADARIIKEFNLKVDEASLTGESVPVEKEAEVLSTETLRVTGKIWSIQALSYLRKRQCRCYRNRDEYRLWGF